MIAGEHLTTEECLRYLKWGKGDLEVGLNYYYNRV